MNSTTNLSTIQDKRAILKELSAQVKEKVQEGELSTVNEALIDLYTDEQNHTFKTFNEWVKMGYKIKKGSQSFLVWGLPKRNQQKQEESEETDTYKFFPLCYLFSNAQVEKRRVSND